MYVCIYVHMCTMLIVNKSKLKSFQYKIIFVINLILKYHMSYEVFGMEFIGICAIHAIILC